MEANEISYKTLRRIHQLEKTSQLFIKIGVNFYHKLSEYLKNLESIIEQEENSQKIKLFNDEIQNTKKLAFGIYELREKKIVQAALSKVHGAKPDLKNALDIEKKLYIYDSDAIKKGKPNIQFYQKLSGSYEILVDAGPRDIGDVVDYLTAGAETIILGIKPR